MNPAQIQKNFVPLFALLLVADFLAQLVTSASIPEFQALVGLWFGPLDDIFYGLAGVQALYYLVDPGGSTREADSMSTVATVKKIAALMGQERYRSESLPAGFFTGSLRAVVLLGNSLVLAVVANSLTSSLAVGTLMLVLQRHLSYLLPVAVVSGGALLWALKFQPQRLWTGTMLAGFGAFLLSVVVDGRWSHHIHHLLATLSSLQAWGAALCWVAAAASLPLANLRLVGSTEEPAAAPIA